MHRTAVGRLSQQGRTAFAIPEQMVAAVLTRHGGPDVLQVRGDVPTPAIGDSEVLVGCPPRR
ncbi:MAG: hypothetical protein ACRDYU_13890 [Actinomycetes bacterium]